MTGAEQEALVRVAAFYYAKAEAQGRALAAWGHVGEIVPTTRPEHRSHVRSMARRNAALEGGA